MKKNIHCIIIGGFWQIKYLVSYVQAKNCAGKNILAWLKRFCIFKDVVFLIEIGGWPSPVGCFFYFFLDFPVMDFITILNTFVFSDRDTIYFKPSL